MKKSVLFLLLSICLLVSLSAVAVELDLTNPEFKGIFIETKIDMKEEVASKTMLHENVIACEIFAIDLVNSKQSLFCEDLYNTIIEIIDIQNTIIGINPDARIKAGNKIKGLNQEVRSRSVDFWSTII